MLSSCFVIPLAAADQERVGWTVRSIRRHCTGFRIFIIADGPRELFTELDLEGDDLEINYRPRPSNRHWGMIWQLIGEGLESASRRQDLTSDCIFVKIDADAIIVRPQLIDRARVLFSKHPECGQLGQCSRNISGKPLPNRGWANYFTRRRTFLGVLKACIINLRNGAGPFESMKLAVESKALLESASRHGYKPGEFAIGGAYMLRREAVEKMRDQGLLTRSPYRFFPNLEEDVIITPLMYSTGYTACDDVDEGGMFAICGKEPWIHPFELCKRGHYIVHPVKYGVTKLEPKLSEAELAEWLLNYSPESDLSRSPASPSD